MNPFWQGEGVYFVHWDGCEGEIVLVNEGRVEGSTAALISAQNAWLSEFQATRIGDFK